MEPCGTHRKRGAEEDTCSPQLTQKVHSLRYDLNHIAGILFNTLMQWTQMIILHYWQNFTISTCLSVIQAALKKSKETLNACWKKLRPECVHDANGFSLEEIQHEAVDKAETGDDITPVEIT